MRWMALLLVAGCLDERLITPDALADANALVEGPRGFGFPLAEPELFYQTVGVDHDPVVQEPGVYQGICADYLGRAFPWCYDGHSGADYLLDGGFDTMDAGSVEILAAADGVVVATDDGHYDRCHLDGTAVTCDGNDGLPNYVILEHEDGLRSLYWHMKQDTVAVEVGEHVRCGDVLGLVGSSGNSSMPHLHFQVERPDGEVIDPYAGPYSHDTSLWEDQGPAEGLPEAGCTAL